jgi:hypothetical protein
VGIWDWLFGRSPGGEPRSANGASSFHLIWVLDGADPLVEVSASLTVVEAPSVSRLYFWALQVTFDDGGGAHVGLQWLPGGKRAVNWGGYGPDGAELDGVPAGNTHPFDWSPGTAYSLRVRRGATGWVGSVDGWSRELLAGGSTLSSPMVWSEVFARCDHPSTRVRWSGFSAVTASGTVVRPSAVEVRYQSKAEGGCGNTDVVVDGDGFVQVTSVPRSTPAFTRLDVQP